MIINIPSGIILQNVIERIAMQGYVFIPSQQDLPPPQETYPKPNDKAHDRGEDLIKQFLGDVGYHKFVHDGYVDMPSLAEPDKRYRIRGGGRMIGIVKLINGEWKEQNESLCIHPAHGFVDGDIVATKIALCQFEEETLLRTANRWERAA